MKRKKICRFVPRPLFSHPVQKLQSLSDEHMRPEFVKQFETLRSKIFKKVKPKQLNNKFLTGEMLIELAQ